MTGDPERLAWAAIAMLAWLGLCAVVVLRERARRRAADAARAEFTGVAADGGAASESTPVLVAYASQTGFAEGLALQAARCLRAAGLLVRLLPLGRLQAGELAGVRRAFFVVSTSGDGDPPDEAGSFVSQVMAASVPLPGLQYAVLALGDRSYADFCGFGRGLEDWLSRQGARPLFERVEVDRAAEPELATWRERLTAAAEQVAGSGGSARRGESGAAPDELDELGDDNDWNAAFAPAPFTRWRIRERRTLNPGSAGAPLVHLELVPADGSPLPDWQAGDLAQLRVPVDPDRLRDYSIASLPADGALHLLVRVERRSDGTPGLGSHLLCEGAAVGVDTLELRLRPHRRFRLDGNEARPLILIGNGSGFAGLRALIKARAAAGAGPDWLVFGERNFGADRIYDADVDAWLAQGVLDRVDRVFSRDLPGEYVQDRLARCADRVRDRIAAGAAVYVCGSLQGMAGAVDATLAEILGRDALDRLRDEGRYRRDVY